MLAIIIASQLYEDFQFSQRFSFDLGGASDLGGTGRISWVCSADFRKLPQSGVFPTRCQVRVCVFSV